MSKYRYNELHQHGGKLQKLSQSSKTFHNAVLHIFLSLSGFLDSRLALDNIFLSLLHLFSNLDLSCKVNTYIA